MTATISAGDGSGTTTPLEVLMPYQTSWAGRNIVHDLIGGGIAISLVTPRPRSGTLALLYATEDDAFGCAQLHTAETTFTLTETERPHLSMTYVIDSGGVTVELNEDRDTWQVSIAFQEVTP